MRSDDDHASLLRGAGGLLGIGALNLACLVAGFALGWFVDDRLGTVPVWTLVGLAVGVTAGIAGSWVRIRQSLRP